jgi:hypothetical protein
MMTGMVSAWGTAVAEEEKLSSGQTLYLPVYSYIWHGDRVVRQRHPLKTPVSVLVSIRNTNSKTPIKLVSARYFDSNGNLLKQYVNAPLIIGPLATHEIFVEKHEVAGGSGANFLLQWEADAPANIPVIEALHAEIKGHSTIAFMTRAQPVSTHK